MPELVSWVVEAKEEMLRFVKVLVPDSSSVPAPFMKWKTGPGATGRAGCAAGASGCV